MKAFGKWFAVFRHCLQQVEEVFLCLLLVGIILLACVQIALRVFFSGGLLWADPLLRYLVLWCGMFGAAMATLKGKHIALDVVSYLVPAGLKSWLHLLIHLFSAIVSAALTWAAVVFVHNEARFGSTLLLSIPSWVWNLVFPLVFALIAFRFFMAAVENFTAVLGKSSPKES